MNAVVKSTILDANGKPFEYTPRAPENFEEYKKRWLANFEECMSRELPLMGGLTFGDVWYAPEQSGKNDKA